MYITYNHKEVAKILGLDMARKLRLSGSFDVKLHYICRDGYMEEVEVELLESEDNVSTRGM